MLREAFLVFGSVYTSQNIVKYLSLIKAVETNKYCSNSVLISLAAHVTFTFPYLDIFEYQEQRPKITPENVQVNDYITYHPFQQLWCDKFYQSILKNQAIRKDNTLYIVLNLQNAQYEQLLNFKQKLKEKTLPYSENWLDQILKSVSSFDKLPRKNTCHAYLNVSGSQLRTDPFVPIINVRALILGQIYNNQHWENYDVLKGEVPMMEKLMDLDTLIIPGSTNSVLSNIPYVQNMSKNIFQAFYKNKKLKLFGICYGHQLISIKNKGYVVKKKRTDQIQKYQFDQNQVNKLKVEFTFLNNMIDPINETLLLQHHEDYVQNVTDDFYVLAKSRSSKVECLLHKSGRMLSFQSHPEYFYEYTQGFMQRIIHYRTGDLPQKYIHKQKQNIMRTHHESSTRMRKIMSEFLSWNCKTQINKQQ